jgi:hypothetical protein
MCGLDTRRQGQEYNCKRLLRQLWGGLDLHMDAKAFASQTDQRQSADDSRRDSVLDDDSGSHILLPKSHPNAPWPQPQHRMAGRFATRRRLNKLEPSSLRIQVGSAKRGSYRVDGFETSFNTRSRRRHKDEEPYGKRDEGIGGRRILECNGG